MRVLGVDLGLQRTGLAVSDELGITVRALPTLVPRSRKDDIAHLLDLCRELEVKEVVVGHPVMPQSGDEGPMAKRARGFAEALTAALAEAGLDVRVHLRDERGTSKAAAERLATSGMAKGKRKAALDGEAARILVEEHLSGIRTSSFPPR